MDVLTLKNYPSEASMMVAWQLKIVSQIDAFKISATRNLQQQYTIQNALFDAQLTVCLIKACVLGSFNTCNKCLTAKLLKHGYQHHILRKAFSKFYRRHYELIS